MRLRTTLAFAITAFIEFSSLGLYFIGTIWRGKHKDQRKVKMIKLTVRGKRKRSAAHGKMK